MLMMFMMKILLNLLLEIVAFHCLLCMKHCNSLIVQNDSEYSHFPRDKPECDPRDVLCFGPSESTIACQRSFAGLPVDCESKNFVRARRDRLSEKFKVRVHEISDSDFFPEWECDPKIGCTDSQVGPRGTAYLFVPESFYIQDHNKLPKNRILYVHGGGWMGASPSAWGYDVLCMELVRDTGLPVLSIDYQLTPMGRFPDITYAAGRGVAFLATTEMYNFDIKTYKSYADRTQEERTRKQIGSIYVMGDSSGGGTAASVLVGQAKGYLPGSEGYQVAGGVLHSPWINLASNSPSYFTQATATAANTKITNLFENGQDKKLNPQKCANPSLIHHRTDAFRNFIVGDVTYLHYTPKQIVQDTINMAFLYTGNITKLDNPVANAFYASKKTLARLPPTLILGASSEISQADFVIFAQRAASAGASVECLLFDGMWHVASESHDGCGDGDQVNKLTLPISGYREGVDFVNHLSQNNDEPRVPRNLGFPKIEFRYEFPRKQDSIKYWNF